MPSQLVEGMRARTQASAGCWAACPLVRSCAPGISRQVGRVARPSPPVHPSLLANVESAIGAGAEGHREGAGDEEAEEGRWRAHRSGGKGKGSGGGQEHRISSSPAWPLSCRLGARAKRARGPSGPVLLHRVPHRSCATAAAAGSSGTAVWLLAARLA